VVKLQVLSDSVRTQRYTEKESCTEIFVKFYGCHYDALGIIMQRRGRFRKKMAKRPKEKKRSKRNTPHSFIHFHSLFSLKKLSYRIKEKY
jgi:hypothetical protein